MSRGGEVLCRARLEIVGLENNFCGLVLGLKSRGRKRLSPVFSELESRDCLSFFRLEN